MKLTVLVDNNTQIDSYYLGEPGVSYYLEDDDEKILFDMGYSEIFLKNAKKMRKDLDKISKVIISHGHDDHTGGLKYFFKESKKLELIAHPNCFDYKEDATGLYIGSPINKEELSKKCQLKLSKEPLKISEHLTFLGEIPSSNDFETRYTIGKTVKKNQKIDDTLVDDSALVYKGKQGLFIITGCSHSGICNIIEYAKKVCQENRIQGVIGGFHLFEKNERLEKTIHYLKENKIEQLYPCHCVSLQAKIEMGKKLNIKEVGVGLEIEQN